MRHHSVPDSPFTACGLVVRSLHAHESCSTSADDATCERCLAEVARQAPAEFLTEQDRQLLRQIAQRREVQLLRELDDVRQLLHDHDLPFRAGASTSKARVSATGRHPEGAASAGKPGPPSEMHHLPPGAGGSAGDHAPVAYLVAERRGGQWVLGDDWTDRRDTLAEAREVAEQWRGGDHCDADPDDIAVLAVTVVPDGAAS